MSEHAWSYLPALVEANILTEAEAKQVVLGTRMAERIILELQAMFQEAQSSGQTSIPITKLSNMVTRIQMLEMPNF